jgi:hypothetical protein
VPAAGDRVDGTVGGGVAPIVGAAEVAPVVAVSGAVVPGALVVGDAMGVRVLVLVARTIGLGVRKSYESVPTRCGDGAPGVNVGWAG